MKKIIVYFFFFFICFTNVNASYVILNQDNNKVLYGSNIHEKRLIASITKVMTAHIVINNANLSEYVTVGDEIDDSHGSSIYLKKGEIISIEDLLYGLLLRSGNDAAIVLAKNVGGTIDNFVKLMNEEANKIGMSDTIFNNPSGLDDEVEGNISTAYDMAILTSTAMKNKSFRKIFRAKHYKCKTNFNTYDWYNKNKALNSYKYVTGGKTGYTKKAKRTLITTASKNNINLIIVTLNQKDDFNFHISNYKYIFDNYNNYLVLNKSNLNINDKFYKKRGCNLYIKNNYFYFGKKDDLKHLMIYYYLDKLNNISTDDIVGSATLYKSDKLIYETPIYIYCRNGLNNS